MTAGQMHDHDSGADARSRQRSRCTIRTADQIYEQGGGVAHGHGSGVDHDGGAHDQNSGATGRGAWTGWGSTMAGAARSAAARH